MIICSESLKLYIGQHKGADLRQYLKSKWYAAHHRLSDKSRLYAAMRKHPRESWSIHSLISGIETRAALNEVERHFIHVLKAQHPDVGYNLCRGGEGFTGPHSKQARRKMSTAIKASYVRRGQAEHQKRSKQAKQRWADPEFKQRVSRIQKSTPNTGRFTKGQKSWNTGTKGVMKPNSGSFGCRAPK